MAAKRRCPACGRLQRLPEDAASFTCDGCGGQGFGDPVRHVPGGLGRRLAAIAMVLVGTGSALSTINHIMMRAPHAKRAETREDLLSLVLPGLLIFGGTILALGKRETSPPGPKREDGDPPDQWQDADDDASSLDVGPGIRGAP